MTKTIKFIISLLLTVSLLTPILPANAKTIYQPEHIAKFRIERDVGIINIQGMIDTDTAEQTKQAFELFKNSNIKNVIIHLHSLGGQVSSGMEVINLMIAAGKFNIRVVTMVDHGEYCASMCTAIFAAGVSRIAAADTIWMFHSPAVKLSEEDKGDPGKVAEAKESVRISRLYMLSVYRYADPKFTEEVLDAYVNDDSGKTLILFGGEIIKHTDFITFGVVN